MIIRIVLATIFASVLTVLVVVVLVVVTIVRVPVVAVSVGITFFDTVSPRFRRLLLRHLEAARQYDARGLAYAD